MISRRQSGPTAAQFLPISARPGWGEELRNEGLREALREVESVPRFSPRTNPHPRVEREGVGTNEFVTSLAFPAQQWHSFGIDALHAGHWVEDHAGHFWAPTELGHSDMLHRYDLRLREEYAEAISALRAERPFVLQLVRIGGMVLEAVATSLRADREVVMAAVAQNGEALQCTPPPLCPVVVSVALHRDEQRFCSRVWRQSRPKSSRRIVRS